MHKTKLQTLITFTGSAQARRRGRRTATPPARPTSRGGRRSGGRRRWPAFHIRSHHPVCVADAPLGVRDDGVLDIHRHLCVLLQVASGGDRHQLKPCVRGRLAAAAWLADRRRRRRRRLVAQRRRWWRVSAAVARSDASVSERRRRRMVFCVCVCVVIGHCFLECSRHPPKNTNILYPHIHIYNMHSSL